MDNVTNHTVTSTMSIVQLTLAIIQQCTADLHLYPIAIKTRKFVFGVINILQVSLRKCIHKCHIVDVDQEALHFIGIILCNFSSHKNINTYMHLIAPTMNVAIGS